MSYNGYYVTFPRLRRGFDSLHPLMFPKQIMPPPTPTTKKTKLAIFDVDGTLFDGNVGIEMVKLLIQNELFDKQTGQDIFSWYGKYKSGEVDKSLAVDKVYEVFAKGMAGLKAADVSLLAGESWEKSKDKLFNFAKPLMKNFEKEKFTRMLISGSPEEMVNLLGKELGIDKSQIIAGRLEVQDGVYTGKALSYLDDAPAKVTALRDFVFTNNLDVDWQNSIAMGDNERDLGILSMVGKPLAFEPNEVLRVEAEKLGFEVVDKESVVLTPL